MSEMSLSEQLKDEMISIKRFHSISPQFRFYSSQYVNKLNSLLYRGLISKETHSYLTEKIYLKNDTRNLHTFATIEELSKAYKPTLGELDLLYSCNLSTIKVFKNLSEGICECVGDWEVYVAPLVDRLNHIVHFIEISDESKDLPDKSCYYHLSILSNALFMSGKVHPNEYLPELVDCYRILYEHVINLDKDFYDTYENSYLVSNIDNGFSKYTDAELVGVNVLDKSTMIHHNILNGSSEFSDDLEYSYKDYLIDKNRVLCDFITRTSKFKSLEEVDKLILGSSMPDSLKNMCSNDLYAVRTSFIEFHVNGINCFHWYNAVQSDFVFHCIPQDIEEGYSVASCICGMLTEEGLIDFAVQQASLMSLANSEDKHSYNLALYEYLFKLNEYDMISSYKDIYNKYKQE